MQGEDILYTRGTNWHIVQTRGSVYVFDLFRTTSEWLVPEELYSRYCSYIIGFHREIFLTQEKPHKQETTRRYNAHMI